MLDTRSLPEHGPVIPVIVIQRLEDAVPMAEALVAGGVRVLEVTLRTPVALKAMEAMSKVPGAIVGAGTLRTAQDARNAKAAGCQFAVSPTSLRPCPMPARPKACPCCRASRRPPR
jgi:2-dehydro-3-deoxyphosphogluconate aldolase/(4S)-4-hydroxy-2-oxoglutarate aldolase